MKKLFIYFLSLLASGFLLVSPAQAVCPVCTVAVGAGVGLSRWLGVDDVITGLWIGGLTVALIIWTINWLQRKNINFKARWLVVTVVYYLTIILPLYYIDIIGHPFNKLWGVDKILLGAIIGSAFFYAGDVLYAYLKKKNNGHAHFPFEKVVLPLAPLATLSAIFYFITK